MNRMLDWTDEMIAFMQDASSYSNYFEKLADKASRYLAGCRTVCDAGCGLGQLAGQLANKGFITDAIDINSNVIKEIHNKNINAVCADLNCFDSKHYDAMIFNYFGSVEQILAISERLCNKVTVIIKRNYKQHRFSFRDNPITTMNRTTTEEFLKNRGIKYEEDEFSCEFGQPFRNINDAVRFFEIYSRDSGKIDKNRVRQRLVETDDSVFPLYLPQNKESSIFVIRREAII